MVKRLDVEFEIEPATDDDMALLTKRASNGMSNKIANALLTLKKSPIGNKIKLTSVGISQARNLANSINQILKQNSAKFKMVARSITEDDSILLVVKNEQ